MKRFQQTAIAFAVAAIAPMAIADRATTDDIDISVTAEVQDFIQVVTSEANKNLTLQGFEVDDWFAQSRLAVFRRGASSEKVLGYEMTLTGPRGEGDFANDFSLSTADDSAIVNVTASYKAYEDNVVKKFGDLNNGVSTDNNLPVNQSMYGVNTLHGQTNLHVTFTLPSSEVETAKIGTYSGDFTVMVTAI